jgi:hypothetical protein
LTKESLERDWDTKHSIEKLVDGLSNKALIDGPSREVGPKEEEWWKSWDLASLSSKKELRKASLGAELWITCWQETGKKTVGWKVGRV